MTQLSQFQEKPQVPVIEKKVDQSPVEEESQSAKKKRARSLGLESTSSVEILNDDELENELENELKELE